MHETRRLRLQSVLQQELASLILREVKDHRVANVTITQVQVNIDASVATVYVSLLKESSKLLVSGELDELENTRSFTLEKKRQKSILNESLISDKAFAHQESLFASKEELKICLKGLRSACGFLRKQLSRKLHLRYIPELIFREDHGFENTMRVHELLKQMD